MRPWIFAAWLIPAVSLGYVATSRLTAANAADKSEKKKETTAEEPVSHVETTAISIRAVREPESPKVDLAKIQFDDKGAYVAQADGKNVRLTVRAEAQSFAKRLMAFHKFPEAAIVVTEPVSGKVLVYASHIENSSSPRDLCREATAPSASVFKIITASALLETDAKITPETTECFPDGGEQKLTAFHLRVDPKRDKYCSTVALAMGKSTNPVFARLASRFLTPEKLTNEAKKWGYGGTLSFDTNLIASEINVPTDALAFARTAAGFWNTTLSPIHAAWISSVIANDGSAPRLHIVEHEGTTKAEEVISKEHALLLKQMLERTVSEGTARKAFHDPAGRSYLPNVKVIGKTGTLTDSGKERYYTWFTGAATPAETGTPVAISVLVVNGPNWKTKANVVAREMLQGFYAAEGVPHVHTPKLKMHSKR